MQFKRVIVAFSALVVMAGILGYFSIGGSSNRTGSNHMLAKQNSQNNNAFKTLKGNMATLVAMNMIHLNKKQMLTANIMLKLMAKYDEVKEMRSIFPE